MQLSDNQYFKLKNLLISDLCDVSAISLPSYCDNLGLPLTELVAFSGKWKYLSARLSGIETDFLVEIATKVKRDYPTANLTVFMDSLYKKQIITDITRQDIFDEIQLQQINYCGRLDEVDFLKRIFNLDNIPSNDHRFKTFEGDLFQHTVNNSDWDNYWIFTDSRFDLKHVSDKVFLSFLCETLHPIVRPDIQETQRLCTMFNQHLKNDGYELYEDSYISGKPIFKARTINASPVVVKKTPFDSDYIKKQIDRMNSNIETNPDLAIGTAKELIESLLKMITGTEDDKIEFPKLQKLAMKQLNLVPENIPEKAKGSEHMKVLLSNLASIVHKLDEIRNLYGTGHGKHPKKSGLEPRHARLAVESATTFVNFVFETYSKRTGIK